MITRNFEQRHGTHWLVSLISLSLSLFSAPPLSHLVSLLREEGIQLLIRERSISLIQFPLPPPRLHLLWGHCSSSHRGGRGQSHRQGTCWSGRSKAGRSPAHCCPASHGRGAEGGCSSTHTYQWSGSTSMTLRSRRFIPSKQIIHKFNMCDCETGPCTLPCTQPHSHPHTHTHTP